MSRRTSRRVSDSLTDLLPEGLRYEKTEPPAFYATAYRVYRDDALLGTVASQRSGRATYWGHATGDAVVQFAGAPSRPLAVLNLLGES